MNLKFIGSWLMLSSKDSTKVSTTVTGGAILATITAIATVLGVDTTGFGDGIDNIAFGLGQLLSGLYMVFGLSRKLYTTIITGTNAVVNDSTIQ